MDHQSFRYYIPGIMFLLPIYFVICWITISSYTNTDIRTFVLLGGITTFPLISLPVGWWIYNAYRVWWLLFTKGGYEHKDFVKLVREDIKPFYSPITKSVLADFSHIKDIESWIRFDLEIFRKTFYPYTSKVRFNREIERYGIRPKFTEQLSDIILFKDKGYDYARSISSVRYVFESSSFALMLSIFYAFGIKYIWLYQINKVNNSLVYTSWVIILTMLTICIIITLLVRWSRADKEYDARLLLTTVTSLRSNYVSADLFKGKIPTEIFEKIGCLNLEGKPFAAFDLDNTLLIDDIGEAVFASLVKQNIITEFGWDDYLDLIKKDRESAYKKVVELMNGLKISELIKMTNELLDGRDEYVVLNSFQIPIPKPNPVMQSIVSHLLTLGVDVFVVTASNKISAEIVCWKYFGIPSSKVFGADFKVDKNGRISGSVAKIPYANGKVEILKQKVNGRPIITGGDGFWDNYLLEYTESSGIRLWLGQDVFEYQEIKESRYKDLQFYNIQRGT
ncbi:MAG: haloacid dehalogenase-like hydrolase [Marinilabiliales bacterium]|nr:haloacid dehalogenase-like hydrolase [Marinilabiliales bacterium]